MKKILLPLVFGALAFPVFGCGNAALPLKDSAPSGYRHISQAEARKMMETQTGYILLDVRTRKEYDEGHIPDAITCLHQPEIFFAQHFYGCAPLFNESAWDQPPGAKGVVPV